MGTPSGNSPAVLPAVIPMSPSQVSIASQNRHIQCSPPINTALVVELISSEREPVLFSLHWYPLHPAPHGTSRILLYADHTTSGWPTSVPQSSTGSSTWPTTAPSWCIRRMDRPFSWTAASGIRDPLRSVDGFVTLVGTCRDGHPFRRLRRICTPATTDEPPAAPGQYGPPPGPPPGHGYAGPYATPAQQYAIPPGYQMAYATPAWAHTPMAFAAPPGPPPPAAPPRPPERLTRAERFDKIAPFAAGPHCMRRAYLRDEICDSFFATYTYRWSRARTSAGEGCWSDTKDQPLFAPSR
jgi:hypothetical protein